MLSHLGKVRGWSQHLSWCPLTWWNVKESVCRNCVMHWLGKCLRYCIVIERIDWCIQWLYCYHSRSWLDRGSVRTRRENGGDSAVQSIAKCRYHRLLTTEQISCSPNHYSKLGQACFDHAKMIPVPNTVCPWQIQNEDILCCGIAFLKAWDLLEWFHQILIEFSIAWEEMPLPLLLRVTHWQVPNLEETLCGLIWHHLSATWCFLLAMTACKRGISHSNCNLLHLWATMHPCTELTDHWHQSEAVSEIQ